MLVQSLDDLRLWNPGPVLEYVGSGLLLPRSKAVIFGAPKLGKSILAKQLAFCLCTGTDWLGFKTIQVPLRCLYVQCEIPKMMFRERLLKMEPNAPPAPGKFITATEFSLRLDNPAMKQDLELEISKHHPNVVFLDSLYKLITIPDIPTFAKLFDYWDYLIETYHITLVVIAHDRKPMLGPNGQPLNLGGTDLSGPRNLEAWFETIFRLDGDLSTDERILSLETRHSDVLSPPIKLKLNRLKLWMERA